MYFLVWLLLNNYSNRVGKFVGWEWLIEWKWNWFLSMVLRLILFKLKGCVVKG